MLVELKPATGGTAVHVPVYAAPKPAADLASPGEVRFTGEDTRASVRLSGRDVNSGSGKEEYRSRTSVLQLHGTSDQRPDCTAKLTSNCNSDQTERGNDLRYAGATSTAPLHRDERTMDAATVAFGVATWHNWESLQETELFAWTFGQLRVDIDTNGDKKKDFTTSVRRSAKNHDVLLARTENTKGKKVDEQPLNLHHGDVDTNVFDSNVLVLPVTLKALGIDAKSTTAPISYKVRSSWDSINTWMSFDTLVPDVWAECDGQPALACPASPGTEMVIHRGSATRDAELLVLQHHNARGDRPQVVKVAPFVLNSDITEFTGRSAGAS